MNAACSTGSHARARAPAPSFLSRGQRFQRPRRRRPQPPPRLRRSPAPHDAPRVFWTRVTNTEALELCEIASNTNTDVDGRLARCQRIACAHAFSFWVSSFGRYPHSHALTHTTHSCTQHTEHSNRTTHTKMLTDRMHARTLVAHKCLHKPTPSMAQVHTGERPHVSGEPEGRGVGRLSDNLSPDHATVSGGCATPPPSTCKRRAASTHPIQQNCHQATSACAAGRPRHPDVVQPYHGTADSARAHAT
jgi:hypothetical protein